MGQGRARVGGAGWCGDKKVGVLVGTVESSKTHRYLDLVQCAKCGCSDVVLIDIGLLML